MDPTISYCVVNSNGRELLLRCLAAIEQTGPPGVEREVLVLDNASDDGSAEAVRELGGEIRLIELGKRAGKAENDTTLLREARGEFCLLLNEDSELLPGAAAALLESVRADPRVAAGGAQLLDASGRAVPCAWRFTGVGTALAGAVFAHRLLTVQSKGEQARPVDWVQSSAMLVRRDAVAEVGYLDPDFFVYYDECDLCRRLHDAGRRVLYVPGARAIHRDQLATDLGAGLPRIVEFHRNHDRYMRKHGSRAAALAVRVLTAWAYGLRALAALVLPRQPARIYAAHAHQALFPYRGEGLRDKAEAYNRVSSSRASASITSGTEP